MNITGVIAEYNPFHHGHLYHLQKAAELTAAQAVVCVMSGHFTQRGEPAVFDKWSRAQMALSQGADLILELPAMYATRSAYWFARGGVETLAASGVVTHLSFGAETADLSILERAAALLADESGGTRPALRAALNEALNEGMSYPRARAKAFRDYLDFPEVLNTPNNILALSYLQIIKEKNIPLIPAPVQRSGSSYHEANLSPRELPSAAAIRRCLDAPGQDLSALEAYIPAAALMIMKQEISAGRGPVSMDALDVPLMTLLRKSAEAELGNIIEIIEGLENRISRLSQKAAGSREFLELLKTKRYTRTRLQRFLIHLLLGYTKDKEEYLAAGPPYLRVLGFTPKGRDLLKKIKKAAKIPLLTKGAHAQGPARNDAAFRTFWEMDVLAGNLYALLYPRQTARPGNQDYYRQPVAWPADLN